MLQRGNSHRRVLKHNTCCVLVIHLSCGVITAGVRAASHFGTADTEKASCSEKSKCSKCAQVTTVLCKILEG